MTKFWEHDGIFFLLKFDTTFERWRVGQIGSELGWAAEAPLHTVRYAVLGARVDDRLQDGVEIAERNFVLVRLLHEGIVLGPCYGFVNLDLLLLEQNLRNGLLIRRDSELKFPNKVPHAAPAD